MIFLVAPGCTYWGQSDSFDLIFRTKVGAPKKPAARWQGAPTFWCSWPGRRWSSSRTWSPRPWPSTSAGCRKTRWPTWTRCWRRGARSRKCRTYCYEAKKRSTFFCARLCVLVISPVWLQAILDQLVLRYSNHFMKRRKYLGRAGIELGLPSFTNNRSHHKAMTP